MRLISPNLWLGEFLLFTDVGPTPPPLYVINTWRDGSFPIPPSRSKIDTSRFIKLTRAVPRPAFLILMRPTSPQIEPVAGPSRLTSDDDATGGVESYHSDSNVGDEDYEPEGLGEGMNPEGFSGPSQGIVKPLTPEALAAFKAAQDKAGIIYISRIPPGMRPAKVRHLMSAYGEVGRVYLQQEGTGLPFTGPPP